jgi:glycosyltransferase involved in cell wall biosynthesis
MRWLLISRQHHPSHGGIGTYVQRFIHAASAGGWHVELMTQPGRDQPTCAAVHDVTTSDMDESFAERLSDLRRRHVVRPYRYALWSQAVAQRLLELTGRFDAIEFVDCQAEGLAALGCPAIRARFAGAAFIVHAHTPMFVEETINGADVDAFGRRIYHEWERRALTLADGVIVTSTLLLPALGTRIQSAVIPYPIAMDVMELASAKREERIILVGTVQPRKGVDVWARSLNEMLRRRPKATALLLGADTPTAPDGLSMAAHVQRLIDPRLVNRFRWIGSAAHDQARTLIAESALLVVPSRLESFSFVAAEALLAGTPVLASDMVGIAEHVPSLPRFAVDDVEALAQAQIDVLADQAAAQACAIRCRDEMLDACSPARVLRLREQALNGWNRRSATHQPQAARAADTLEELSRFIADVDSTAGTPVDVSSAAS